MDDRVLAYVQKSAPSQPHKMEFKQSVLDALDSENGIQFISAKVEGSKCIIEKTKEGVKMKRPLFCPIHNLSEDDVCRIDALTLDRGVNVAASLLVESRDQKILLTRRARHMRIFPHLWVPPGGHIEKNETIVDASLRELKEETGLKITEEMLESKPSLLAAWESVYPPNLTMGPPRRHHVVFYLHAQLNLTADRLTERLQLQTDETDACLWADRSLVEAIVSVNEEESASAINDVTALPKTIPAFESSSSRSGGNKLVEIALPQGVLLTRTGGDVAQERVSTGTKFALEEWLARTAA